MIRDQVRQTQAQAEKSVCNEEKKRVTIVFYNKTKLTQ